MADEIQTFKALICIHKVLQEGHPVTIREAHTHTGWLESLTRGIVGEGLRGTAVSFGNHNHLEERLTPGSGYGPLIREYVYFLLAKLAFHRHHPEFNGIDIINHRVFFYSGMRSNGCAGVFDYEEYISLKTINDPNEG